MHDRYDAQIWLDHHDQFSEWIARIVGRTGSALRRGVHRPPAAAGQLLAATAAVSLTLLTFTASAV